MPAKLDPTAPRKKYALLRFVRHWNKAHPKRRIERPRASTPRRARWESRRASSSAACSARLAYPSPASLTGRPWRGSLPPGVRGQVMAVVHSEVGTHEWPTGSNWGPVKKFLKAAGIALAAPWCAAFVTWALRQAGYTGPLPASPGWVDSWLELRAQARPPETYLAVQAR